jgi:hypothetical protein
MVHLIMLPRRLNFVIFILFYLLHHVLCRVGFNFIASLILFLISNQLVSMEMPLMPVILQWLPFC